jgi:uncharacterized protein
MTETSPFPAESPNAPDSLARVLEAVRLAAGQDANGRRFPPVDQWHPPDCGDIGMEIRADGSWWHAGSRINREPLVALFASVLRKDDDGRTWLVTPYEKVPVAVEDAHFRGIAVDRHGQGEHQIVTVTTNLGDVIAIGKDNPLVVRVDPDTREPHPLVTVRGRLTALLSRAAFYELVDWGVVEGTGFGIWSQGQFFKIDEAS